MSKPRVDSSCLGVFAISGLLCAALLAPWLVGRFIGHGWALLVVAGDVVGWVCLYRRQAFAPVTLLVWIGFLVYLLFVAALQLMHLR